MILLRFAQALALVGKFAGVFDAPCHALIYPFVELFKGGLSPTLLVILGARSRSDRELTPY